MDPLAPYLHRKYPDLRVCNINLFYICLYCRPDFRKYIYICNQNEVWICLYIPYISNYICPLSLKILCDFEQNRMKFSLTSWIFLLFCSVLIFITKWKVKSWNPLIIQNFIIAKGGQSVPPFWAPGLPSLRVLDLFIRLTRCLRQVVIHFSLNLLKLWK